MTLLREKEFFIIIFVSLICMVSLLLKLFISEPYPAIAMPKFGYPNNQKNIYTYYKPYIHVHSDKGTSGELEIRELMPELFLPLVLTIIEQNFRLPCNNEILENNEVKSWLLKRSKQLCKCTEVIETQVIWKQVSLDLSSGSPVKTETRIGSCIIKF